MRRAALVAIALLVACTEPQPELPIDGAVQIAAPVEFAQWWRDIEACSGRTRPDGVTYYVVEGSRFRTPEGTEALSAYQYTARRMIFARRWLLDAGSVRHEMLHAVLPPASRVEDQHPPMPACASLVDGWE